MVEASNESNILSRESEIRRDENPVELNHIDVNFQGYFKPVNHNAGINSIPYMKKVIEQDNLEQDEPYNIYHSESCEAAIENNISDREQIELHDIEANVNSSHKFTVNDFKEVERQCSRKVSILNVNQQEHGSEDHLPSGQQDDSGGEKKEDDAGCCANGCCAEMCRVMFAESVLLDLPQECQEIIHKDTSRVMRPWLISCAVSVMTLQMLVGDLKFHLVPVLATAGMASTVLCLVFTFINYLTENKLSLIIASHFLSLRFVLNFLAPLDFGATNM